VDSASKNWYEKGMQMKKKRRTFSGKFKAKVAIEAIKGVKTMAELATEYEL